MRKYNIGLFHGWIIAFFLLVFVNGCGYKSDPYWVEKVGSVIPNKGE